MDAIQTAVDNGKLLESSAANIAALLKTSSDPVDKAAVAELVQGEHWEELNDRFFKTLAFGTGGLRSRTVGRVVTQAERGHAAEGACPQFSCVGTNGMNYYNVSRATRGLIAYVKQWVAENAPSQRASIAISHDTRYFSREFAEYAAKLCTDLGVDAYLVESCRATPQVSFAVRHFGCTAGIMLTASHNPAHDNGYKVYFNDGSQIVEPYASGIIAEVNALTSAAYDPLPESEHGKLTILGKDMDELYMDRLQTLMLQPDLLEKAKGLKVVFTNLHGTGGVIVTQMLERLGFNFITVPEQDVQDGAFPTVASPNPENPPALAMAMDLAKKEQGDIVIGTDPDCDRMGVAVRDAQGEMVLLTGNQIGSLLAYYRTKTMIEKGMLTDANKERATLVKTFVTTNLQTEIANHYGISCVNTLTGFKYIGQKLSKYEQALPLPEGKTYGELTEDESRALRLQYSKFFVFGGEESYGYLGGDFIRDKDGNAAVVMFCELAAYAVSRGLTLPELMDEVYQTFGYYKEELQSVVMEGAEGAGKIQKLANSYTKQPPKEVDGSAVKAVRNFAEDDFIDEEGDAIPREKMIMVDLEDGRSFAVRPSGTEPKIKYYLFSQNPTGGKTLSSDEIASLKDDSASKLKSLWNYLEKDIQVRLSA
ncbi:MAG: phospho-sugar mutase [Verrucomicrobiales bacterium]|nr:phospho-sugar mutase [Verrucomicrobiales bacterium]